MDTASPASMTCSTRENIAIFIEQILEFFFHIIIQSTVRKGDFYQSQMLLDHVQPAQNLPI